MMTAHYVLLSYSHLCEKISDIGNRVSIYIYINRKRKEKEIADLLRTTLIRFTPHFFSAFVA